MDFIKAFFKFFSDAELTLASKAMTILLFLGVILIADNIIGFSFYYNHNQKINQLQKIEEIKLKTADSVLIAFLNKEGRTIMERKNIFGIFVSLFSSKKIDIPEVALTNQAFNVGYGRLYTSKDTIYSENPFIIKKNTASKGIIYADSVRSFFNIPEDTILARKPSANIAKIDSTTSNQKDLSKSPKTEVSRSSFWHTVSSSYLFLTILLFLLIIPIFQKPFKWDVFIGCFIMALFMGGVIWVNQLVFKQIPIINNKPWMNYLVNFTIQSILLIIIIYGISNANQKKKK